MAVREFAVNEYVQWSIGTAGLDVLAQAAFTVVGVAKIVDASADGALLDLSNAGTSRALWGHNTADMRYLRGSFQDPGGGPAWGTGDDWVLVAWTKVSGTVNLRFHKCVLSSDTWTHQDSTNTVDSDDNTCTFASTRPNDDGDFVFRGRIAAIAAYDSVLNDAAVEALRDSFTDWLAAGAIAAWRFDQANTSDPIDDQTAGGADQTTLVGSTVVTGDDPPGFSFDDGAVAGSGVGFGAGFGSASASKLAPGAGTASGGASGDASPAKGGTGVAEGSGGGFGAATAAKLGSEVASGAGAGYGQAQVSTIRQTRAFASGGGMGRSTVSRTASTGTVGYGGGYGADRPPTVVVPLLTRSTAVRSTSATVSVRSTSAGSSARSTSREVSVR